MTGAERGIRMVRSLEQREMLRPRCVPVRILSLDVELT